MEKKPFDLIVYHPPKRCFRPGAAARRLSFVGLDTETFADGSPLCICTPDEELPLSLMPKCLFFKRYEGRKFVTYNLKFDSGVLLRHLPLQKLTEIRTYGNCEHEGYKYQFIPYKELKIVDEKRKKTVIIWDIAQFFGTSLETAAQKYLGEGKMEMPTKTFTPEYVAVNRAVIVEYCKRDALLVQRLAEVFRDKLEEWGLNCPSLLSTAYVSAYHFRKKCRVPDVRHLWNERRELLRAAHMAYAGGLFQAFRRGSGYMWEADISSAYPYELANLVNIDRCVVSYRNEYRPRACYGFMEITVNLPACPHPVPVKRGSLNVYPAGKHRVWVTKQEYEYLLEVGAQIEAIHEGVWVYCQNEEDKPLREEIYRLYQLKSELKDKDRMGYHVTKVLMNSLYGKFVQLIPRLSRDGRKWLEAGVLWNPVYGAVITANVRCRVARTALENEGSVVLVATDSIIAANPLPLDLSGGLGGWEKAAEGHGLVIGSGVYEVGEKTRFRGFDTHVRLRKLVECQQDAQVLDVEILRPYTWKEVVFHGWDAGMICRFEQQFKKLDINFDRKRIWERDWQCASEILDGWVESFPLYNLENLAWEEEWERLARIEREAWRRYVRRTVLACGGVNDPDYEGIPRWARRRGGRRLDDLATELAETAGIPVADGNDLFALLLAVK